MMTRHDGFDSRWGRHHSTTSSNGCVGSWDPRTRLALAATGFAGRYSVPGALWLEQGRRELNADSSRS